MFPMSSFIFKQFYMRFQSNEIYFPKFSLKNQILLECSVCFYIRFSGFSLTIGSAYRIKHKSALKFYHFNLIRKGALNHHYQRNDVQKTKDERLNLNE